ncbi:MAG: addiction module protein [Symploca sp. SIO2E9]|nr:addiction module protein [Symploca sp. SIO2E9]
MMSAEQITQEALSLPNNLRIQLVDKLLASLEVDVDENTQAVWLTEAKRRRDEIHSGIIQAIPGEEALAQVRQILS